MRRDFDFVSIDDYKADMADTAEIAANAVAVLRRENDHLKLLIGALVQAAGGRIDVYRGDSMRADEITVEHSDDPANNTVIYRTKPKALSLALEAPYVPEK